MPITAPEVLTKDLAKLGKFGNDTEARNRAFIKALCTALQNELLKHYETGKTADARLKRLAEISLMFRAARFKVGTEKVSIAAYKVDGRTVINYSMLSTEDIYNCPKGTSCIDGNCVPVEGGG